MSSQAAGRLIGLWLLAEGAGVVFILDAVSHEAIHVELTTLPMYPYAKTFTLLPLLPHPGFPEFGLGRSKLEQT